MTIELYATPPSWISEEEFSTILQNSGRFIDFISNEIAIHNRVLNVTCIIYESASTRCHATKIAEAAYEICIPIGFLEKAALLHLIAARHSSYIVNMVQSPLDRSVFPAYVPTILQPLFDRISRTTKDRVNEIKEAFTDEVSPNFPLLVDTISSSLNFLIAHEFSHISLSHFEFQSEYLGDRNIFTGNSIGFTEYEIKQGLEVAADLEGAKFCTSNFWRNDKFLGEVTVDEFLSIIQPFLLGVTIGICLFDSQKRHLDDEVLSYYPHPLIRIHLIWGIFESSAPDNDIKKLIQEEFAQSVMWVSSGLAKSFIYGVSKDNFLNDNMRVAAMTIPLSSLTTDTNPFFASVMEEKIGVTYQRYKRAKLQVDHMKNPLSRGMLDLAREVDKQWQEYQDFALAAISKELELRQAVDQ
jgi:hypothetical protein